MAIDDAIAQVEKFRGESLAETISTIEADLAIANSSVVRTANQQVGIDHTLLLAAGAVKRASAEINVVIHAVGILYALPHLLRANEVVEGLSLGAGSAGSDFDVVTNERIAEFKFIHWQKKGNAERNRTLFQDFFKLAREDTKKKRFLYLLRTEAPLRFLRGRRNILSLLSRNRQLAEDFTARYGDAYRTVGEYYAAHGDAVQFVSLVEIIPGFAEFMQFFEQTGSVEM